MSNEVYSIGKGKLLFKQDGTTNWEDLGNCPDFKISNSTEVKDHFSSRSGIQVKDLEVLVKQTCTGKFTLDEPKIENIRRFMMSDTPDDVVQNSGTLSASAVTVEKGKWQELGKMKLSSVVVKDVSNVTTYVAGTDYEVDTEAGLIRVLPTSASIDDDDVIHVSASYAAITTGKAHAAKATTVKGHIWFVGNPPVGQILDVKGYVSLKPDGDMSLIGEDWMSFGFSMEFLQNIAYTGLVDIRERGTVV